MNSNIGINGFCIKQLLLLAVAISLTLAWAAGHASFAHNNNIDKSFPQETVEASNDARLNIFQVNPKDDLNSFFQKMRDYKSRGSINGSYKTIFKSFFCNSGNLAGDPFLNVSLVIFFKIFRI